jgi:MraZ protein
VDKCEAFSLFYPLKSLQKIDFKERRSKMSFVGSFKHSLDAKKRVFIPAKFRDELGEEFYITRKFDTYLSIYTAEDWEVYVEKIQSLPETVALDVQDFLLGIAQKCVPDSNGRIILDDRLAEHAGINKNIVFVGGGRQIRIWAEEIWNEREKQRDLASIREIMNQYGL